MSKLWLIFSILLLVLGGWSCKEYAFENPVDPSQALAAPTNLQVTGISDSATSLSWNFSLPGADYPNASVTIYVERCTDGVNFTLVDSVGANTTTKSVAGVYLRGTTYSFRVKARSTYNYSSYSNVATGFLSFRDASMVLVTTGTFQMGSTTGQSDETPVHSVTVGSFHIDKTEITYEKWTAVYNWGLTHGYIDLSAGQNGYNPIGTNNPVAVVSWYDILKWCNARSEKEGLTPVYYTSAALDTVYRTGQLDLAADAVNWTVNGYRLPTEAEWEFAARGGTSSKGYTYSGSNNIDSVAWYSMNSGSNTHPVSSKGANELGLYDMTGSAWEWCWDWYGAYSESAQTDPKGSLSGTYRVLRGGSFLDYDVVCRVARRVRVVPSSRYSNDGFRCVQK